jgi:prepilin-type N-terminal cleavage/methylation domain-containing protein
MTNLTSPRAFSLIEITLVLLIMAIAAGVVLLRTEGPMNQARMRDVVDQVAAFDALSRARAVQQDAPVHTKIDLNAGQMQWASLDSGTSFAPAVRLPEGYAIATVLVRGVATRGLTADILYSRLGLSPSYALRLDGPNGRQQWLLVTGLTGQVLEIAHEQEVRDILAATSAGVHAG